MIIIKHMISFVVIAISKITFVYLIYELIMSLMGIYDKKDEEEVEERKSFALLVAAHNEEKVISDIIKSLKLIEYPKEKYDIFVVADNCDDNTAKIAREDGAIVYERHDLKNQGKGYAMEWMFKKIFNMDKQYDTIAIFDADNLVSKNFLNAMNKKLCQGYKVVQGYLDSKNPEDSWITGCYSLAFWQNNRTVQLAKQNIGLSAQLGGTGFCIDIDTLRSLGWGATCLTEDLEFTCKLVSKGEKVGWAHDAVIYDEKPLTLKQSWNQRKRWMKGFADVSSRYFFKLIKYGVIHRSWTAIDCAIYSIQPYFTVAMGITLIYSLYQGLITILTYNIMDIVNIRLNIAIICMTTFMLFLYYVYYLFIMSLDKKLSYKMIFYYVMLYYFYLLTWMPISFLGIIEKNNKEWCHTVHTRSIDISEMDI